MTVEAKQLERALKDLGNTPRGIARKLAKEGVRGQLGDAHCCVVAVYLRERFPDEDVVEVFADVKVNGAVVRAPEVVNTFITQFDDVEHPDLIQHNEGCDGVSIRHESDGYWFVDCGCGIIDQCFWKGDGPGQGAKARAFHAKAERAFG